MNENSENSKGRKFVRRIRTVLILLAVVVLLLAIGFEFYVSDYYHANDAAVSCTTDADYSINVNDTDNVIEVGSADSRYGIVFYPGGKVEPKAYIPLACKFAQRGVFCVIAKMPFNLAVLNINVANDIIQAHPNIQTWWVGGHSLGGSMAAQYAGNNADKIDGVALLAAYSTSDLTKLGLKVQVVYGSNDEVVNKEKLKDTISQIGEACSLEIEGGNHAGFGDYGLQDGDGVATISSDEQQEQAVIAIVNALTN